MQLATAIKQKKLPQINETASSFLFYHFKKT